MRTDRGHGSPHDRGKADSWYRRGCRPHYYEGATGSTLKITDLAPAEVAEYVAGYNAGEAWGEHKEWD